MSADGDKSSPPAAPEKSGKFEDILSVRMDDISKLLAPHITRERFEAAAHAAIRQNPDLLDCTQRSLFNALTKAAQDGLLPDGKESVITSYKTKIEGGGKNGEDIWVNMAQYNPMLHGIRKRARESDGIIIDAQVVYANDFFERDQGDEPRIIHKPAPLDKDPGGLVGSYAVFKREDGTILHREVMRKSDVEATREQSRAKNGLLWTKFATEGWRKAAVRRGSKTVPFSDTVQQIITRDDENFDFRAADQRTDAPALTPPPAPKPTPPSPPKIEAKPEPQVLNAEPRKTPEAVPVTKQEKAVEPKKVAQPQPEKPQEVPQVADADEAYTDWKRDVFAELEGCQSEQSVEDLRDRVMMDMRPEDVSAWRAACAERSAEIFGGN